MSTNNDSPGLLTRIRSFSQGSDTSTPRRTSRRFFFSPFNKSNTTNTAIPPTNTSRPLSSRFSILNLRRSTDNTDNTRASSVNGNTSFGNDNTSSVNDNTSSVNDNTSSVNDNTSPINDNTSPIKRTSSSNDRPSSLRRGSFSSATSSAGMFFKWVDTPRSRSSTTGTGSRPVDLSKLSVSDLLFNFTAAEVNDVSVGLARVGGSVNKYQQLRTLFDVESNRLSDGLFTATMKDVCQRKDPLALVHVLQLLSILERRFQDHNVQELLAVLLLRALGMDDQGFFERTSLVNHLDALVDEIPIGSLSQQYNALGMICDADDGRPVLLSGQLGDKEMRHREVYFRLQAFFIENNISKLDVLPAMMSKYDGKEETLVRKLEKQHKGNVPNLQDAINTLLTRESEQHAVEDIVDDLFHGSNQDRLHVEEILQHQLDKANSNQQFKLVQSIIPDTVVQDLLNKSDQFWKADSIARLFQQVEYTGKKQWKHAIQVECWMRVAIVDKSKAPVKISECHFKRRWCALRIGRPAKTGSPSCTLAVHRQMESVDVEKKHPSAADHELVLDDAVRINMIDRPTHKHQYTIEIWGESSKTLLLLQPSAKSRLRTESSQDPVDIANEWILALRLGTHNQIVQHILKGSSTWKRSKRKGKKIIKSAIGNMKKGMFSKRKSRGDSSASKPMEVQEPEMETRVRTFFELYNPGNLKNVKSILKKYKNREDELLVKLEEQYGARVPTMSEIRNDQFTTRTEQQSSSDEEFEEYPAPEDDGSIYNDDNFDPTESSYADLETSYDATTFDEDDHHGRLTAFYTQYNADKLKDVDMILEKYRGREDVLFKKLEKQYGIESR